MAYGLVIPLRMFSCEDAIYGTFSVLCAEGIWAFALGYIVLYGLIYVSSEESLGIAYGLVIPLRMFPVRMSFMARFLFYMQKEFEPWR
jgi:hypothetical protein